jgi:hypothetical protein
MNSGDAGIYHHDIELIAPFSQLVSKHHDWTCTCCLFVYDETRNEKKNKKCHTVGI